MASDGNSPVSGVGQMNISKNKVTFALCFALLIILQLNDGVEASANDAKPTFMHLPMRLRNPRGVGLSHQGARTSNPDLGERESVQEDHSNTVQVDNMPRFPHLPPHMHDPRGVHVSKPMEEANAEPVSDNPADSATPEVNQARFSHLPRLHNPLGVKAVQQVQEVLSKENCHQAEDEGNKQ